MLLLIRLAAPGNGCSKSILLARNLTTVFCRPSRPRPSNTNKRAHTRTRSIQYSKWRFLGTGVGINNAHLFCLRLVYYFPLPHITKLTPDFQTRGYDEWAFFMPAFALRSFRGQLCDVGKGGMNQEVGALKMGVIHANTGMRVFS